MKRLRFLVTVMLVTALLLSVGVTAAAATAGAQGAPNASKVLVNNYSVSFEAYTIEGNNYFKLRDLAMAFVGSAKQFSVGWDGNTIRLMSGERYNPVGSELTVSGGSSAVTVVPTIAQVYFNGKILYAKAYNIDGYNYFKLRDIGAAMNFSVTYDTMQKAIRIDLNKEYYLPALLEILPDSSYDLTTGFIHYKHTDSGSIMVTKYSPFYYSIIADNIGDNDFETLNTVIGVFVSAPEQILAAADKSRAEGQQELQIEGKIIKCYYSGSRLTITMNWL